MKKSYIFITFALVLILIFILWLHSLSATVCVKDWQEYQICSGDTLYEIAERYNDGSYDPRELVYMIQKHNGISPMLKVGQSIQIPTGIKKSLTSKRQDSQLK